MANISTNSTKTNDRLHLLPSCLVDVSYLIRYEASMRHLRGIYEASYSFPWVVHIPDLDILLAIAKVPVSVLRMLSYVLWIAPDLVFFGPFCA